ncbi:MAG TPA: amino acid adenylation domain-containing protein, partial [Thermoanaerobaculia bacterium]|nr:amino acid adenylation domain-containing protein [Thermoanaerobaculia bacterium]
MEDISQGFRLSFQQEQLWRLQNAEAGMPRHALGAISIRGLLRADLLQKALREILLQHEILRTSFRQLPGLLLPLQVIDAECDLSLERLSLEGQHPEEQERRLELRRQELLRGPSDGGRGPALRAVLAVLAPDRHVLLLDLPALCADAATFRLLVQEVGALYQDFLRGGPGRSGEPLQYVDVSEWQYEFLASPETLEGRKFWRRPTLLAETEVELPLARSSEASTGFEPRWWRPHVAPGQDERLHAWARRHGVDAGLVLLACWHVLLHRLTARAELAIGVAHAGRKNEELVGTMGLLTRYLPLSVGMDDSLSFRQVVEQVGRGAQDLHEWQEYFDRNSVTEARDDSRVPFFPFCFEYEELPEVEVHAEAGEDRVAFSLDRLLVPIHRFTLKLSCLYRNGSWQPELHYDAGAVRQDDAERLGRWYHALLDRALEDSDRPVAELEILTEAERHALLSGLNATALDLGATTLPEVFAEQARSTPESVALVFGDRLLTYAELQARAGRLAVFLRGLGVGPETRVALGVERSPEMVVGILGILEAGGAYVPLDPAYPGERLAWMLEDSAAPVLLTGAELSGRFPDFRGQVVLLDDDWPQIEAAARDAAPETPRATPENLAYVIYTSGSTGRPKGVMVPHRAILNRLLWMRRAFPLAAGDGVLQKTPYSFDASIWEIFVPLFCGARLVVAEPGGHRDPAYLLEAVERYGVTTLQLVPSQLSTFLEQRGLQSGCRSLRRVFCGGEALPWELAGRFFARLEADLANLYGPTEAAIDATFHPLAARTGEGTVPIGRPLANVQVYLLDRQQRLVPAGLPGELYIGGAGLARGYLLRPEWTAERFVPHPFSALPGERLYRTGDLARLLPGGDVEFLGRIDNQVKVRGFRIELGEIEAALARHPAVVGAAVTARGDGAGDDLRLVAYVVMSAPGAPDAPDADSETELWGFLRESLPEYMLPADFVFLDALPLSPSGKLDRNALPEPQGRAGREDGFVAPRTAMEELLAGLWKELLHVERIGAHDDFFELGGHSLQGIRLMSRVREVLGIELRVRALFEAPTLAELSRRLEAERQGTAAETPIQPLLDHGVPLRLSSAQERLWFLEQLEPGTAFYNIPGAVRMRGALRLEVLAASVDALVERHESLRTVFGDTAGKPYQVVLPRLRIGVPLVDLAAVPEAAREAELKRLAIAETRRPFDLSRGPMIRFVAFRSGADDHLVVHTLHHIVSDGWSS